MQEKNIREISCGFKALLFQFESPHWNPAINKY